MKIGEEKMWPFKKKREVIDLTYLAKRGIVKTPEDKDINLTPRADPSSLGFLGEMASGAESGASSAGISRNKIEDIEFKLDSLMRKVDGILDRLDVAERKVSAIERRSTT
jgi:hypothetical protein